MCCVFIVCPDRVCTRVHCVVLTCEIKVTVSDSLEHGFILVLFRFVEGGEAAEKDVCDNAQCPHVHLLPITRTPLLPRHVQNLRCNIPEWRGVNVWKRVRRERRGGAQNGLHRH